MTACEHQDLEIAEARRLAMLAVNTWTIERDWPLREGLLEREHTNSCTVVGLARWAYNSDKLWGTVPPRGACMSLEPLDLGPLPEALDINCPKCGGHLTAQVGPPNGGLTPPTQWSCPYCQHSESNDFGGVLHWIVRRSVLGAAH
jgi:hypothetical protein